MSNIKKLKAAIEADIVTERLIDAVLTQQKRLKNIYYRFAIRRIVRKCAKSSHKWYPGKNSMVVLLKNAFGDFSLYEKQVDKEFSELILVCAAKCLKREFDILGSGGTVLESIDWHADFVSGYRWEPGRHYRDYIQVDTSNNADVKIPRELSRCHHFLILGQAYLITRDEKYTDEFVRQILDWIEENPLMRSINWGCTMDVAIRAMNWILALNMFVDSYRITDSVLKVIVASCYEHGFFIYRNPEKYKENNHNHYISDLAGQIYLGIFFKGAPEAPFWLSKGKNEIFREVRTQILPSGPSYEKATSYHRLVLELLTSSIILLDRNNEEIPSDIRYRLEKMYEFVLYYLRPDGFAPIIGDQDDGRAHPFGLQSNLDHRYLLSIAAILFNRPDFKRYSNGYNADCFFLLGAHSKLRFQKIPGYEVELLSKSFADAGFYIMRAGENYMFINASGKSGYSEYVASTHTHSDLLSFELVVNGKAFLVDPGSYLYSADPAERMNFRSTKMHNTITIDGESQNVITEKNLWDFEDNVIPVVDTWESDSDIDCFEGSHPGYQRLSEPITHRRKIVFDKRANNWQITDRIVGYGKHLIEVYFHFDENIDIEVSENKAKTKCGDGENIVLEFDSRAKFGLEIVDCWVSKRYGEKTTAKVLVVSFDVECPLELTTTINTIR